MDEMVEVVTQEDEINELARQINADSENHTEEYMQLLETKYTSANARKLHFETLLRLRHNFPSLWDNTLNVICSYLEDTDPEVRKIVAKKILQLCNGGKNVSQVSGTLAQVVALNMEGASVAEDSLRILIKEHPGEAITSIYSAIDVLDCDCHKLNLLKYLDKEISKLGTIGDAMRKKIYDVFYELLADPEVNKSIDEIKKVFFCAVDSSFFPNTVDRIQLVNKAQLNLSFENNPEVVEMYRTALSLVGWIDDRSDFAWKVVESFTESLYEDAESNRNLSTLGRLDVREICKVIVEITRKTKRFLFLPDGVEVKEEHYVALFNTLMQVCPDPSDQLLEQLECDIVDFKDVEILFIESVVIVLYNLMPEMPPDYSLLQPENRKHWVPTMLYLINVLRKATDKWKADLNKNNCENREQKEILLHASNNIGMILMDFMKTTPKRVHSIVPSWVPNWRAPRLVASAQSDGLDDQSEAPKFEKGSRAAPRSSGYQGKRRATNVPSVNMRKRNRH